MDWDLHIYTAVYKTDKLIGTTDCIVQGTRLSACGDLNRKEIQKEET